MIDKVFSGLSPATGYNGDEDQGLMGSLAVLMKIGLFQMNGGTENDPVYELGSPLFDRIEISLHPDYYTGKTFSIKSKNNGQDQWSIKNASLDNEVLNSFSVKHSQLVKGGELELELRGE